MLWINVLLSTFATSLGLAIIDMIVMCDAPQFEFDSKCTFEPRNHLAVDASFESFASSFFERLNSQQGSRKTTPSKGMVSETVDLLPANQISSQSGFTAKEGQKGGKAPERAKKQLSTRLLREPPSASWLAPPLSVSLVINFL